MNVIPQAEHGRRLLAVDTATFAGSVALLEEDRVVAELSASTRVTHSESLLADIEWLLGRAHWTLQDIDAVGVSIGPGSFTGVRIGVVTCRSLAWTLGLPLVGVSSLETLAMNAAGRPGLIASVLDARKKEVYLAVYRFEGAAPRGVLGPLVLPPAEALRAVASLERRDAEPVWMLGDGVERFPEILRDGAVEGLRVLGRVDARARGAFLGLRALAALHARGFEADPLAVEPLYVRASEAELADAKRAEARRAEAREG